MCYNHVLMAKQELDREKHDRSVELRRRLLHGIDARLKYDSQNGYKVPPSYLDVMAEGWNEPSVVLNPSEEFSSGTNLHEFVNRIYEGANVRIRRAEAGFSYIMLNVENTREEQGVFKAGSHLVIPIQQREIALAPQVYLFPDRLPITYAVQQFTIREWIRNRIIPFDYRFEEREVDLADLGILEEIVDAAVALPKRPKWTLDRPKPNPSPWVNLGLTFRPHFREDLHLVGNKIQDPPQSP